LRLVLKNLVLPLANFTLEVNLELKSRVTAIFGPSGAGKTSLLDVIAGLRNAKSACIELDDVILTDTANGTFVPPRDRRMGYVPQDLGLFPHFSVRQNLLYGHKASGNRNSLFRFEHVIDVLEIQPLVERRVGQLSGGEKQRIALARALLTSPRFLLLDEPLANLDIKLKSRIIPYLARVRDEFDVPMLYVTHDRFEAMTMADEIAVLINGKVAQTGAVEEVFNRPANMEVADLLTVETIRQGRIVNTRDGLVEVAIGSTTLIALEANLKANTQEVFACIRAEDVTLVKGTDVPGSSARNHLVGIVKGLAPQGPLMRVDLDCGFPLAALLTKLACKELGLRPGERVLALIKAPNVHLIPR